MKLNKLFLIVAVALGIGLTACNNDEVPNPDQQTGSTYVGVSIALPGAKATTRALPGDFNENGEWDGRDKIETITVFLVNATAKTVDYTSFNKDAFNGISGGVLTPTIAVKATPGNNVKAYVVVNGTQSILDDLKTKGADAFAGAFAAAAGAIASEVASFDGTEETIMMTNTIAPAGKVVEPKITKTDAINGTNNRFDVQVERVVSRAIVTMAPGVGTSTVEVKNAQGEVVSGSTITISNVEYAVGQSNRNFYIMKDANYKVPDLVYNYVPNGNWAAIVPPLSVAGNTYFDYTGLKHFDDVQVIDGIDNAKVKKALTDETTSKFVLPVTHATDNYRKGNSTYFEIRATFTPAQVDGVDYSGGATDFFLGTNDGKFYSTNELAIENGQKAIKYTGGVMKYVLWLNPNKPYGGSEKITESPTVRNQVYHAHITGFKEIGVNANPLDPETPEDPDNPIKPDDPLQNEDTYLSVSITVLKWGMHSYEVNLGNEY